MDFNRGARQPENELDIIVFFKTGEVYPVVALFENDESLFKMYASDTHFGYFKTEDFTHWMPLPASPHLTSAEAKREAPLLAELKAAAHNLRYCPENYRRKHLDELDALIERMEGQGE